MERDEESVSAESTAGAGRVGADLIARAVVEQARDVAVEREERAEATAISPPAWASTLTNGERGERGERGSGGVGR